MECPRCKQDKASIEFPPSIGSGKILRPRQCWDCRREADKQKSRRYREENPEKRRETQQKYDARRPDRWAIDEEYRKRNLEACRRYHNKNKEKISARNAASWNNTRLCVLKKYGGSCACCGESHSEFLVIDHINGGGSQERKELSPKGVYNKLYKTEELLPGYRVLCHNCNSAYAFYGYCPHQPKLE